MVTFRSCMLGWLTMITLCAGAQEGGDLQAQILYAFHAEDANELTSLVQTLSTRVQAEAADAALRYHLAHAEYRLGLLARDPRPHEAEAAFADCIDQLKPILQRDPGSVESLALQSACYSNLARSETPQGVLLRRRAAERLRSAGALAPRNPRVVFLSAADQLARAEPGSAESARAVALLELAVQLFEQSSATRDDVPGWGHAEAYLELGRQLQGRGDVLGARNWIEKSLLSAPDYKAAQRQLAALVRDAGRRSAAAR